MSASGIGATQSEGQILAQSTRCRPALPELVQALLTPLYQLFGFFDLPKRLVEEELAALQKRRF